jgi:Domain of unknown function (DUF4338)/Transposase DNA-binding
MMPFQTADAYKEQGTAPALYTHFFALDFGGGVRQAPEVDKPVTVCRKTFSAELIAHLSEMLKEDPSQPRSALARVICQALNWFSTDGRPALASARVALRKLEKRGLLVACGPGRGQKRSHRLRASGQRLPAVNGVPRTVQAVKGLHLYLLCGHEDPQHALWNDFMIQQHPCGDAPLTGPQLRYLISSEHGWLGALGFGPAAFALGARDQWIGWSTAARVSQLARVIGLARLLIRTEVKCHSLASKVLSLVLERVAQDWQDRYGVKPVLVETFVDRARFTGLCFAAANWMRIGRSTGRGRLGPKSPERSLKDIWVYPLVGPARRHLLEECPLAVIPRPLIESLAQEQWCAAELARLQLGDERLHRRAEKILQARWEQPQASFNGSFAGWAAAKGAYSLIANRRSSIELSTLLESHTEATQARMAAENVVLLPQDTTTLNFTGLRETSGLGPLGEDKGQGLWLHCLLAYRPDGVPLGLLQAKCWARPKETQPAGPGRNAKSIEEKESVRWVEALQKGAVTARRMTQTQLVVMADREGDLYEMHDAAQSGPSNLQTLIRAQHDRNLECHQKLWAFLAQTADVTTRTITVPRRRGQPARVVTLEVRWSAITIESPKVGCKKGWPSVSLWAVWAHEPHPPEGVEAIDWMLLSNRPISSGEEAWARVQWYRCRWGIEEWHRVLKTGCAAEQREFKTAEHLQRVLAFDLIVAWRILACLKLGRALPQLPATVLYTKDELAVLCALQKKETSGPPLHSPWPKPTGGLRPWADISDEPTTARLVRKPWATDCAA